MTGSARDIRFRTKKSTSATAIPGPHTHAATDTTSAVFSPSRLASGTPAAGMYPDGTGVWTVLPGGGSFQPLDSDLTAIAAIAPANDDVIQRKSGSWVNRTMAQLKVDLAIAWADVSGAVSAVNALIASAITTERSATRTLTNVTLTSPVVNSPTGIVKGDVGLGNVDNTSDVNKPVSTAQAAADTAVLVAAAGFVGNLATLTTSDKSSAVNAINEVNAAKAPLASPAFTGTPTGITKAHVGLGSVDNTADAAKAVLSATKWATARTIALTGDVTYSQSVDGSANVTGAATLSTTGVSAGTYGSATSVPVLTIDTQGRVTAAAPTTILLSGFAINSGSVAVAVGGTGATTAAAARANLGIRPAGWKFNLLTTSGAGTDPGAGNARFYTGGAELFFNYTDADGADRSGYFSNIFNTWLAFHFTIVNGATACELGTSLSVGDNGTYAEVPFDVAVDATAFTAGQPLYLVVTPIPTP